MKNLTTTFFMYFKIINYIAMKTIIGTVAALTLSVSLSAQNIDSTTLSRLSINDRKLVETHLENAKGLKVAGFSALGLGMILNIIGFAQVLNYTADYTQNNASDGTALIIAGSILTYGSIPLFLKSNKNKKNANLILYRNVGVCPEPNKGAIPQTASMGVKFIIPIK